MYQWQNIIELSINDFKEFEKVRAKSKESWEESQSNLTESAALK